MIKQGSSSGAARSFGLLIPASAFSLVIALLATLFPIGNYASAQTSMRPAQALISPSYLAEIGKTVPSPGAATSRADREVSNCRATCDAFVPRQPVLTVEWENEAAGTGPAPSATGADTRMRLDISGTASGFDEGQYSTIRLSNIPVINSVVLDPASPTATAAGEVLLSTVDANRIVERQPDLPVFNSPNVMNETLPRLSEDVRSAVQADQRTGALGQVRVLGRASTPLAGVSQQMVTMVGLQPGSTYRLRLVEEQDTGAVELFEQICRIPVCPADFVNPNQ